jgi:hypothetical protein
MSMYKNQIEVTFRNPIAIEIIFSTKMQNHHFKQTLGIPLPDHTSPNIIQIISTTFKVKYNKT